MVVISVPGISLSNEAVFFWFLASGPIAVTAAWKALRMSLLRGNKENEALHTPRWEETREGPVRTECDLRPTWTNNPVTESISDLTTLGRRKKRKPKPQESSKKVKTWNRDFSVLWTVATRYLQHRQHLCSETFDSTSTCVQRPLTATTRTVVTMTLSAPSSGWSSIWNVDQSTRRPWCWLAQQSRKMMGR
jgi:hypothetical protein